MPRYKITIELDTDTDPSELLDIALTMGVLIHDETGTPVLMHEEGACVEEIEGVA